MAFVVEWVLCQFVVQMDFVATHLYAGKEVVSVALRSTLLFLYFELGFHVKTPPCMAYKAVVYN